METTAAGLKAFSTWNTTHTLQTGREACGGEGYLAINRFAALKADSDIFTTFEGDNTVLMQLVAKNLLTDFRDQFKGKGKLELARWAFGRKLDAWASRNPLAAQHTGDLRAERTQVEFFRRREERLLLAAGARLRALTAGGRMSAYEAFTAQQNELLSLAFAHVERVMLESFNAAIRECADAELAPDAGKIARTFSRCITSKKAARGFWKTASSLLPAPAP